jgi:diguanylate cyclase (GGDEF)-like protein/PAS domain S-box-containing protein
MDWVRLALEMTSDAVCLLAPSGLNICDSNQAACSLLGYSHSELRRMTWHELAAAEPPHDRALRRVLDGEASHVRCMATCLSRHGNRVPVELTLRRIRFVPTAEIVAVLHDLRERRRLESLAEQIAQRDPLTGLPNRVCLERRLCEALAQAHSEGTSLAVLFIDLDNFKPINDTWGHFAGDRVLRAFAQRLRRCLPPQDLLARYGGDEFVVLVPNARKAEVRERIRTIRRAATAPVAVAHRQVQVALSIGTAWTGRSLRTAVALLHAADQQMYRQKHRRRRGGTIRPGRRRPGRVTQRSA